MSKYCVHVRGRSSREAGFTLLELLVSMTVLGLLMVFVFGGLRFGVRAWERSETYGSETDAIRLAQVLVRHEIERAYPLFVTDDPSHAHVDFSGSPEEIDFLAPAANALIAGGRARVRIARSVQGDNNTALVIATLGELSAADDAAATEVLLSGLSSLEFGYYGQARDDDARTWHRSWSNQTRLPELIRVQARYPSGDARVWPELIVAPHLTADVSCLYDVLTKYCRGR